MGNDSGDEVKKLIFDIDDNPIEIEVRVDQSYKAVRYELTASQEINPLDAAFCLWLIISNVCEEADISVAEFMRNYSSRMPAQNSETKH